MGPRSQLQSLLEGITEHVYFQPPNNLKMQYPCIRYERDEGASEFADNRRYKHAKRYQVTVIDLNPTSDLPDKVEELPLCRFNRYYAADNLNHHVFNLYF